MEDFDININLGEAKVKIMLQSENFKGNIERKIIGAVSGKHAINEALNFEDIDINNINDYFSSDCDFRIYKDEFNFPIFRCRLKNNNGNTATIKNFDLTDLDKFIVGVEIIEYKDCKI